MKLDWKYERPKNYYDKCVEMFGKPDAISPRVGGIAIWRKKGMFEEHILRDEDVKHCVPRPHHDYFYSSIVFYVPDNKLCDTLKISGSLNYDGLKKLLTARCGAIGANYATLYLAMAVASGKLSIKQVKKNDMYPKMIQGKIMSYPEMKRKMKDMKKSNNKKYSKQLGAEYATYAYKKCYEQTKKKTGGSSRKTRKISNRKVLINTRNESCKENNWTSCCPHMPPDVKGRYAATNESSTLKLDDKNYKLHTCCKPCSVAMQSMWNTDKSLFKKLYKPIKNEKGDIWLHNRHTGKKVQMAKIIK